MRYQPAHTGQLGVPTQQLIAAGLATTTHCLAQVLGQVFAHEAHHLVAEGVEALFCVVHVGPHGVICRCSTRFPMAALCTSEAPS